jgi:peptidoglycan/xylan/chitin deacetylase (PgdA/CDA1 family)
MRYRVAAIAVSVLLVIGLGTLIGLTWARRQQPGAAAPTPSATVPAPTSAWPQSPSPSQQSPSPSTGASTSVPGKPTPTSPTRTSASPFPSYLLGKDIEAIPTSRPVVALTFDAGANGDGLASILATLSREHVPGTFFITGNFANRYPAAIASVVAGGHRLGNHSATHPYFTSLSEAVIRDQLARAEAAIRAAGGSNPRPLFRFPYGDRNAASIAAVNRAGYAAVRWTVDTLGWKGTGAGITVATVVDRVVRAARAGEIVLMHIGSNPDDHSTLDADALPTVIAQLRARGYGFVTLDALL